MILREKVLLLQMLMHNIRSAWDSGKYKRYKDKRIWKILELIKEISIEARRNWKNRSYNKYSEIDYYTFSKLLGLYLLGDYEGRILRQSYKEGGYEDLEQIHGYTLKTFKNRSKEFRNTFKAYAKYPEQYGL